MSFLAKFVDAQKQDYANALAEIRAGKKRSHWMWYIFPQLAGLGKSATAQYYAIADLAEAEAYLAHPILGKRLIEICQALLQLPIADAHEIFGSPDDMKLKSSMTLFATIPETDQVFGKVLEKFFHGEKDI